VSFEVTETLKPGSKGSTPIIVFGSAAADGSGCLNLDTKPVGGVAAKSIDADTLRLSATPLGGVCPGTGGAPVHDLSRSQRYSAHVGEKNGDGIRDLTVHSSTREIGGDPTTTHLYLTGRFSATSVEAGACFEAMAPVNISGN
jgi:hypothetical protein